MRYWLIVPAAGTGSRFGGAVPKQYAPLRARTVIEWSLAPFLADSRCVGIVVVLASDDALWPSVATRLGPADILSTALGGSHRAASVRNGLAQLESCADDSDWVLVHDAARPCLSRADLDRLLDRLQSHPLGGLLAAPAADTLKAEVVSGAALKDPTAQTECRAQKDLAASKERQVSRTVDRSGMWRALTPQMFRFRRLCSALDAASASGRAPTDESQALEWLGDHPELVPGSAANIKVTSMQDLLIAEALLSAGLEVLGADAYGSDTRSAAVSERRP